MENTGTNKNGLFPCTQGHYPPSLSTLLSYPLIPPSLTLSSLPLSSHLIIWQGLVYNWVIFIILVTDHKQMQSLRWCPRAHPPTHSTPPHTHSSTHSPYTPTPPHTLTTSESEPSPFWPERVAVGTHSRPPAADHSPTETKGKREKIMNSIWSCDTLQMQYYGHNLSMQSHYTIPTPLCAIYGNLNRFTITKHFQHNNNYQFMVQFTKFQHNMATISLCNLRQSQYNSLYTSQYNWQSHMPICTIINSIQCNLL